MNAAGLKKIKYDRNDLNTMRKIWWVATILWEILIIYLCHQGGDLTPQAIDSICSNFIIIATAILVVTMALYPIGKEMLKRFFGEIQQGIEGKLPVDILKPDVLYEFLDESDHLVKIFPSISVANFCAICTIFCSIAALFMNGIKNTDIIPTEFFVFLALFCFLVSIAEISELLWHLGRTVKR
jgi:hypothetical protein